MGEVREHVTYDAEGDRGFIVVDDVGGGYSTQPTFIQFQHGPVGANGVNGIQNEQVIKLLIERLMALNDAFPCRENVAALAYLHAALSVLNERTRTRVAQGVEGTDRPHQEGP